MSVSVARLGLIAAAAAGILLGGCASVRDHKGYIVDSSLIDTVQPGVDTRDSVYKTLGRASLESQFDQGRTWYYIARDTRQLAFANPHPVTQMLLTVRFAPNGEVAAVQKTGLETIRGVSLYGKTTPTLGRNRGILSELFGGIGSVGGAAQGGPSADNPSGN